MTSSEVLEKKILGNKISKDFSTKIFESIELKKLFSKVF
ncbi:hypothetical protein RIEPE_0379 [Candidatus Riesia pediculicola USDA]|uniref:Uncharacterized protein n=1 Tax=Riesia pediculicola (strain USDA) TaxID=515618 RepID=D4G8G7_RIEPU|nr:hypothetical protein RIEPE_0379 [Candidatus Riesia pediculicola USDA]